MQIEAIESLILGLRASGVEACEIRQQGGERLLLRLGAEGPAAKPAQACSAQCGPMLVSDGMGIYRSAHPFLSQVAALEVGSQVGQADVIGFLQVGERLQALRSAHAGSVAEILVGDGDLVGYGQALFRLD